MLCVAVFMTALLVMLQSGAIVSLAGSWRPADDAIYQGEDPNVVNYLFWGFENIATTLGDVVLGLLVIPFLIATIAPLDAYMNGAGINIDSIIYGNVGNACALSNGNAYFTFEFRAGNFYGTAAMIIYNILFGVFVTLLIAVVLVRLCVCMYSGNTGKSRNLLKDTLKTACFCLIFLYVMPKIYDLALYIRDVMLYTLRTDGLKLLGAAIETDKGIFKEALNVNPVNLFCFLGSGKDGFVGTIRNLYVSKPTFLNAILYAVAVFSGIVFAFNYASVAMTQLALFVMFPLVAIMQVIYGGRRIQDWSVEAIGLIAVPVIDAVLLLIPITIGYMSHGQLATKPAFALIEIIAIMSIMPARDFIRARLGLGSPSALEKVGAGLGRSLAMLGMTAASMGMRQMSRTQGLNDKAKKDGLDAEADKEIAETNGKAGREKVQDLEKKIAENFADDKNKREAMGESGVLRDEEGEEKSIEDVDGYKAVEYGDIRKRAEAAGMTGSQTNALLNNAAKEDIKNMDTAIENIDREVESNNAGINADMEDMKAVDRDLARVRDNKSSIAAKIHDLATQNSKLRDQNSTERADFIARAKDADPEKFKELLDMNGGDRKAAESQLVNERIASNRGAIENHKKNLGYLDTQADMLGDRKDRIGKEISRLRNNNNLLGSRKAMLQKSRREISNTLSDFRQMGADIDPDLLQHYDNMATIQNFEQKDIMKHISPERRAELREERARYERKMAGQMTLNNVMYSGAGMVAGGLAGLVGGPQGMMSGAQLGLIGGYFAGFMADNSMQEAYSHYRGPANTGTAAYQAAYGYTGSSGTQVSGWYQVPKVASNGYKAYEGSNIYRPISGTASAAAEDGTFIGQDGMFVPSLDSDDMAINISLLESKNRNADQYHDVAKSGVHMMCSAYQAEYRKTGAIGADNARSAAIETFVDYSMSELEDRGLVSDVIGSVDTVSESRAEEELQAYNDYYDALMAEFQGELDAGIRPEQASDYKVREEKVRREMEADDRTVPTVLRGSRFYDGCRGKEHDEAVSMTRRQLQMDANETLRENFEVAMRARLRAQGESYLNTLIYCGSVENVPGGEQVGRTFTFVGGKAS